MQALSLRTTSSRASVATQATKRSGTQRLGGAGYKKFDGDALWLPNTERRSRRHRLGLVGSFPRLHAWRAGRVSGSIGSKQDVPRVWLVVRSRNCPDEEAEHPQASSAHPQDAYHLSVPLEL